MTTRPQFVRVLRVVTDDLHTVTADDSQLAQLTAVLRDPNATNAGIEHAALQLIHAWANHPNYGRCARYGRILHAMRHHPDTAHHVAAWPHGGSLEAWHQQTMQPADFGALVTEHHRHHPSLHRIPWADLTDSERATIIGGASRHFTRLGAYRALLAAAYNEETPT